MRDFIAAARSLRKNIGFTSAVVAMLAVGIGATTAMFSVADGVLFAPLPYANEARLFSIVNNGTRKGDYIAPIDLFDVRDEVKSLDEVGGFIAGPGNLTGDGDPARVGIANVTANWFTMLGIRAQLGRVLAAGEDGASPAKVVVISDALWRTRFGGDRSVLGRTMIIDSVSYTVIGVASPQLALPFKLDIWRPMLIPASYLAPERRGNRYFQAVVRLAPGATIAQARAEFKAVAARLHQQYPVAEAGLSFDLMPLRQHIVGDAGPALLLLFAAVSCVLLIACANVAGLLLLRARRRSTETGIRLALGASPARVVRETLAESLLYGMMGGVIGIALAELAVRMVVRVRPGNLPLLDDVAVDWRVMAFAVAVTLMTAVVFGIAPAIFASKTDLVEALTSGSRSTSAGKKSTFLRHTFVVLELALALVLLVGAGLLGRSLERMMAVNVGFRPANLVHFDLLISYDLTDTKVRAFTDAFIGDLRSVYGTSAVAAGFGAPFTGPAANMQSFHIEGHEPDALDKPSISLWKSVVPGYFETLGIPLAHGRTFTDHDRAGGQRVVVVNEAFVKAFMPGESPIGKLVTGKGEIVGVVADTKNMTLTELNEAILYYPFDQYAPGYLTIFVRSTEDPAVVVSTARKRLATINKNIPIFDAGTYDDLVRSTASLSRLSWELSAGFSAFALLLAVAGIYSVVGFAVRQQRREFGIRMALGAQQRQIMRLVLSHAIRLAAMGLGIGLVVTLATSSLLRSMLYGVGATDFTTYVLGCAVLVFATIAASFLPARSAARVDPMTVMRSE